MKIALIKSTHLRQKDLKALSDVISEAEEWRGLYTGDCDPRTLEDFDAHIETMKEALRRVQAIHAALKEWEKRQ